MYEDYEWPDRLAQNKLTTFLAFCNFVPCAFNCSHQMNRLMIAPTPSWPGSLTMSIPQKTPHHLTPTCHVKIHKYKIPRF